MKGTVMMAAAACRRRSVIDSFEEAIRPARQRGMPQGLHELGPFIAPKGAIKREEVNLPHIGADRPLRGNPLGPLSQNRTPDQRLQILKRSFEQVERNLPFLYHIQILAKGHVILR